MRKPRGAPPRKRAYFDARRSPPSDDEEGAARAARRRRLDALRAEVDGEDSELRVTDAWERMLKEREALARAPPEPAVADSVPASDAESMSISGDEAAESADAADAPPLTAEQEVMTQLLGFTAFGSTKGQPAEAQTDVSGVRKRTKRRYRQYMNRKGGFNRPLSPVF